MANVFVEKRWKIRTRKRRIRESMETECVVCRDNRGGFGQARVRLVMTHPEFGLNPATLQLDREQTTREEQDFGGPATRQTSEDGGREPGE